MFVPRTSRTSRARAKPRDYGLTWPNTFGMLVSSGISRNGITAKPRPRNVSRRVFTNQIWSNHSVVDRQELNENCSEILCFDKVERIIISSWSMNRLQIAYKLKPTFTRQNVYVVESTSTSDVNGRHSWCFLRFLHVGSKIGLRYFLNKTPVVLAILRTTAFNAIFNWTLSIVITMFIKTIKIQLNTIENR